MPLTDAAVVDTDSDAETNTDRAYEIVRERLVMLDIDPANRSTTTTWPPHSKFGRTPAREALQRRLSDLSTIIVRGGAVRRRDDRHVSPYPDVSATHGAAHRHRKAPHKHKRKGGVRLGSSVRQPGRATSTGL